MAAPEYVPIKPMDDVRAYESPPRRPDPWLARRPGDAVRQDRGLRWGYPGPDQGYALTLVPLLDPELRLGDVHRDDAVEGCLGVALKRASLFGRAPVVFDLRIGFLVWGFLDDSPPAELTELRRHAFAGIAHPLRYAEARTVADAVRSDALRSTPTESLDAYRIDWRAAIDVDAIGTRH